MIATTIWFWVGFIAFVLAMLAVDLGVFNRTPHVVHAREALAWTGVWVALALLFPNPVMLIIIFFGALELYRRWKARKSGSLQQAAYYRVSPRNRLLVGAVYIGLVAVLVLGMDASHILASGGHSFRSL